jgi:AcrR family transcriptional regulator
VETLNNILSSATKLIYEKGYHGANIAEITQNAGVSIGTFYVYFDGKLSLYRYLLLQFSHKIRKELSVKIQACTNRREAERTGLKAWLELTIEYPYMYNIIWESLYVDYNLFYDYYEKFSNSYISGIDVAKAKGEVVDIDSEVLAYTMMGISNFLGLKYGMFQEKNCVDLDYVTDEVMKLLDGGIFGAALSQEPRHQPERKRNTDFRVEVDFDFLREDMPEESEE